MMLVLRLEMWPEGNQAKARPLGVLRINNVGGDHDEGNYHVELDAGDVKEMRVATVRNWVRSRNAWALVYEALAHLGAPQWRKP